MRATMKDWLMARDEDDRVPLFVWVIMGLFVVYLLAHIVAYLISGS